MSNIQAAEVAIIFPELKNIKTIKEGGQKQLFSATSPRFGGIVIKFIKNVKSVDRLSREVDAVKLLKSKNVPTIYESSTCNYKKENHFYLIEQEITGDSLQTLLEKKYIFTLSQIVNCLEMLLTICLEMEKIKIVHRDINPNNIMLDCQGKFWLLDFGISRHLDLQSLTNTNQPFGPHTPGYSPPEQFRNMKKDIDSRADLFCIGITIYELITGKNPFVDGAKNPLDVLRNTETRVIPMLSISGDTQNQLAAFIDILSSKYLSRRPKNVKEAYDWFIAIKPTLII